MTKLMMIEFETIAADSGVVDIGIRYNTNNGSFEYVVEVAGQPEAIPSHEAVGILESVKWGMLSRGYTNDRKTDCNE